MPRAMEVLNLRQSGKSTPVLPKLVLAMSVPSFLAMFVEAGGQHHTPHFHAYYQEHIGIYDIVRIERLAGSLPRLRERLVLAWAELHQQELMANWETLQEGRPPIKIDPLK